MIENRRLAARTFRDISTGGGPKDRCGMMRHPQRVVFTVIPLTETSILKNKRAANNLYHLQHGKAQSSSNKMNSGHVFSFILFETLHPTIHKKYINIIVKPIRSGHLDVLGIRRTPLPQLPRQGSLLAKPDRARVPRVHHTWCQFDGDLISSHRALFLHKGSLDWLSQGIKYRMCK